jgi:hypothetical protein
MAWLPVARNDVKRFRAGLVSDGFTPLSHRVSFPWNEEVEAAVATVLATMYVFINVPTNDHLAYPNVRTAVLFKLVSFLSRTGRVKPKRIRESMQEAAMAASVLAEYPHLIEEPVNFKALLARFRQTLAERRQLPATVEGRRPTKPDRIQPRRFVWASVDKAHVLTELFDPWHLIDETDALGHCIGRPHGNKWTGSEGDVRFLPFWRNIIHGYVRVFSLGRGKTPLCTLCVQLKPPTLTECEGRRGEKLRDQLWFPALVDAIAHLRTRFPELAFGDLLALTCPDVLAYCDPNTRIASLPASLVERRATLP